MEAFNPFSDYARKGWLWNLLRGDNPLSFGWGAFLFSIGLLMIAGHFLAKRGWAKGDRFAASSILILFGLLSLFVLFPIGKIVLVAFGSATHFMGLQVLLNTITLAICVSLGTTLVGLVFALLVHRSRYTRAKPIWNLFSTLPLITPPFVVGLSLIFLLGRSGFITNHLLGIETNTIIGFPGLVLAQIFSFAPVSFMILLHVLRGIDPTLEEASFTLGAGPHHTFRKITWTLLRPGLANAFLLTMIESFADFANPIIIGGDYHVLSTEIYFSIIGKYDEGLAASLGLILLLSTLVVFLLQRLWLGKRSYVTVTGKPQGRVLICLPPLLDKILVTFGGLWSVATFALYIFFFAGAFVKIWGIDFTFTLEHFAQFQIDGLDSFYTSVALGLVAAPFATFLGLFIAYFTHRQRFRGRVFMEFISLLNFAVPGTVISLGYLLAFNKGPISMTGTASILVFCFVFRNMAVGIRAGVSQLAQMDVSLEEASLLLGGNLIQTGKRILLPLMRGAVITSLSYSFVRSITAISAIIFLVSAEWNLATKVILDRIEYGRLGVATAYCTLLVFVMGVILKCLATRNFGNANVSDTYGCQRKSN